MTDSIPSSIDDRLSKAISNLSENQKEELLTFVNALQHERRQHQRKKHLADVNYADPNRSANGFIQNISAHGLYIEPNGPFAKGRVITMTFRHPNGETHVKVTGKIVRKDKYGIGVQFDEKINDI